jgi:hypothetical protein
VSREKKPTAEDALRLLSQLDDAEQGRLLSQIFSDPAAPLHGQLDMLLKTGLHAMKSALHVFVSCRDRPSDGGHLFAAELLRQIMERNRWSWGGLYRNVPQDPQAVNAVKLLSPDYAGGTLRLRDQERVRKAIRDLERHARTKAAKAEEVYQIVLASLPPWVRQAFPGIESYFRLY